MTLEPKEKDSVVPSVQNVVFCRLWIKLLHSWLAVIPVYLP